MKKNKEYYTYLKIRAEPYYNLAYAIKKQAFKDLKDNKDDFNTLYDFCKSFFVEDVQINDKLLSLSLKARSAKMLQEFIKYLENLIIEVENMKMKLEDMYNDMLKDDVNVDSAPVNDADEIEEKLEQAQAHAQVKENESEDNANENN